jgi:hypothetical protein
MHASPQFTNVQKKLNDNHLVAFIVAKVDIKAGEELLWKYDISQGYRGLEPPPTPSPITDSKTSKKVVKLGVHIAESVRCSGCVCINPCPSLKNCLTAQVLSSKRRCVVDEKENYPAKQACVSIQIDSSGRCVGCKCRNPCSSLKNCLTPQEGLAKRVPATARRVLE